MEDITVIGAGAAGLTFVEKIREENNECKITLIDKDKYYLPKAEVISSPGDISRRIEIKSWAENKNVEFINDFVDRINPRPEDFF